MKLHPEDEEMLRAYVNGAREQKQLSRVEKFLQAGLTNHPIDIEWHRTYQSLTRNPKRDTELTAFYDTLLGTEPTNSALLYLRGRLATNHAENRRWFEQAAAADPRNPYPAYAMGYEKASLGDWAGAKAMLARAVELRPKNPGFAYYLNLTRLALGELPALEQEYRQQLKSDPVNGLAVVQLVDTYLAAGKTNEAQQAVTLYERIATSRFPQNSREICATVHRYWLYANGNFAELEQQAGKDQSPLARSTLFCARLEQGRIEEALKALPASEDEFEPLTLLSLAVALRAGGKTSEAEQWQARALTLLEKGDDDARRAAALLRQQTEPTEAELSEVITQLKDKAMLLVALAQKYPAKRPAFAAAARQLNVQHTFPYHLIQRLTSDML